MREERRKKREGEIHYDNYLNTLQRLQNPVSAAGQLEKKKSQSEKLPFAMELVSAETHNWPNYGV